MSCLEWKIFFFAGRWDDHQEQKTLEVAIKSSKMDF